MRRSESSDHGFFDKFDTFTRVSKVKTLYQLHTGNTIKIKSRKKYLEESNVGVGKIIKILEIKDEPKWRKDMMGEWYRSAETEPILTRLLVLK